MKNNFDLSYLYLISKILSEGTLKEPARENMPRTLSLFGTRIEHDMREGFPLLTTKKVGWKSFSEQLHQYICQTGAQQEGLFTDSFKGGVCIKEGRVCGRKIIQDIIN